MCEAHLQPHENIMTTPFNLVVAVALSSIFASSSTDAHNVTLSFYINPNPYADAANGTVTFNFYTKNKEFMNVGQE